MKPTLLIIDDDTPLLKVLQEYFKEDYEVHTASEGPTGIALYEKILPMAVILDLRMPVIGGMDVLEAIRALDPNIPIIILTAYGEIEEAVKAIQAGARQFLVKPVDLHSLSALIKQNIEKTRIHREYLYLKEKSDESTDKIILPPAIWKKIHLLSMNPDTTVLITGPTGSGKSMVAKIIHNGSVRKSYSFIDINCAGLSMDLLESELFGHERGAFTDAKSRKTGLMETAHRGTLFLDEIGEMPLSVQSKILSAIESRTFRRIGGTVSIKTDARIIAATNADLFWKMENGQFREDLYYRLNVIPLHLSPLKERKEDIPKLVGLFLGHFADNMNKAIKGFTDEAISMLVNYPWPGNIRELKNIVERAVMVCEQEKITVHHLSRELRKGQVASSADNPPPILLSLEEAEKRQICLTLRHTKYNKAMTARILRVHVSTLSRKIRKYKIGSVS